MWPRFTTKKEKVKMKLQACKSVNVNEEYLCAVRTKSFAEFFVKVQILDNDSSSQILLDPGQEACITSLLQYSSDHHYLKPLLFDYFDMSAEASNFCSELLRSLNQLQDDHTSIHNAINGPDMMSELRTRVVLEEGFSKQDFSCIHEKHSSVLQQLKANRKRVARKIKMIKFFNKASGVCVTALCGLAAAAAVFVALHGLAPLIMGPFIFAIPIKQFKKKFRGFRKHGFILRRAADQLDVAAKGAYILNRDFDTMGRLVARLQDEVKHKNTMIQLCSQRMEADRFSLHVLKELNKYELGFRKQVEELQEHVYLCLATINRARALVVKEINFQD